MKHRGHVYMAHLIHEELFRNKGWLMHYCGDMYGHQYVNLYSYGWFPSIADLLYDAVELVGFMPEGEAPGNSDTQKAVSFFADRVKIEEIATWVDDPSAEPFTELLNDPKNQEEFCQTMNLDQDDPSLWEKITQIIELVVKACGVINGIATIIRHLAIESYMDKTIQDRLDAQDVDFMEEGTVAYDIE